eukprot:scaffold3985_cov22-Tisochrysis_lutea.AAC.1
MCGLVHLIRARGVLSVRHTTGKEQAQWQPSLARRHGTPEKTSALDSPTSECKPVARALD